MSRPDSEHDEHDEHELGINKNRKDFAASRPSLSSLSLLSSSSSSSSCSSSVSISSSSVLGLGIGIGIGSSDPGDNNMPHPDQSPHPHRLRRRTRNNHNNSHDHPKGRKKRPLLKRGSSFMTPILVVNAPEEEEILTMTQRRNHSNSTGMERWFILFLSCFLLTGNFYAFDNPAALNLPLQEYLGHDYDTWQNELNLLYSVYSFPNMFLPFFGGQLVDRMDTRIVLLFFSLCVCTGQTLFSIGVSNKSYPLMLAGRSLFGIGGETVSVVQSSITTNYFKNHEMAVALGFNLCISRLGSVANANLSPWIQRHWGTPTAVWCGALACYSSFFCAVVLCFYISPITAPASDGGSQNKEVAVAVVDSRVSEGGDVEEARGAEGCSRTAEINSMISCTNTVAATNTYRPTQQNYYDSLNQLTHINSDTHHMNPPLPQEISSSTSETRPSLLHGLTDTLLVGDPEDEDESSKVIFETTPLLSGYGQESDVMGNATANDLQYKTQNNSEAKGLSLFAEIRALPQMFWLVCVICMLLYGTIIPFNNTMSDFLMSKWYPNDLQMAGFVMSIPDSMSAILVPFCGFFVDKYGYRASLLFICALVICTVHLILGLTHINPIPPLVVLGLAYSFYGVALWPSIGTIVLNEEQVLWERSCAAVRAAASVASSSSAAATATDANVDGTVIASASIHSETCVVDRDSITCTHQGTTAISDTTLSSASTEPHSREMTTGSRSNESVKTPLVQQSQKPQPKPVEIPVPPRLLGTAYGLSTAALNTSLTMMPIIAAQVRVLTDSWTALELFFALCALGGVFTALTLWAIDSRRGGLLQQPETQR